MANTVLNTTYLTYPAKGLREDLENVIYDISPEETPLISTIGRTSAKGVLHEWQTDALAAVNTANAQLEGLNYTDFPVVAPSTRTGNYQMISGKLVSISGTLEAVDKAGRASEKAYQMVKKSKELKRDIEAIVFENLGGVGGSAAVARQTATLGAWIRTNVNTTGANPAAGAPVPTAPRTDGAVRALTEPLFKDVMKKVWTSGGTLKVAYFGPINKQNASKVFTGIATKTYDQSRLEPMPTIGASDVYVGDFGTIRLVASRWQRERDCWLIDPEYLALSFLRPFMTKNLAETGDAQNTNILAEWGLVVKNEAAHGLLADLDSVLQ